MTMNPGANPLDDARQLVLAFQPVDGSATVPLGKALQSHPGLGRLGEIALQVAAIRAPRPLALARGNVVVFAGSHGVARRGVSTVSSAEVSAAVQRIGEGAAPLNAICAGAELGLKVLELAIHLPTDDFTEAPALDERACAATVAFGMEAAAGGADLLVLGALSAGGEASSAAILAALLGGKAQDFVGAGGLPEHMRRRQAEAVEAALIRHRGRLDDPLEVLRRLGGREHAAMLGALIAARAERVAVVLDGASAVAAALVMHRLNPHAMSHCLLAHRLTASAQAEAAAQAGLTPLLDLGLFAGDGQAGALAAGIVRSAVAAGAVLI